MIPIDINKHKLRISCKDIFHEQCGPAGMYLVGGSLRDCLLGKSPKDYDLVVRHDPQKTARRIAGRVHSRPVTLGKDRKRIIRVVAKGYTIDIASLHGHSIEENLRGRDFTINAMAYDMASHRIIDISHGLQDLENKRIRMVSGQVFRSDPVRLLRAFRLAAVLGFDIDPATSATIVENALHIKRAAGERIKAELMQILAVADSFSTIDRMAESAF